MGVTSILETDFVAHFPFILNWKEFKKKWAQSVLRYCPSISLEGLRKIMKTLSKDRNFLD